MILNKNLEPITSMLIISALMLKVFTTIYHVLIITLLVMLDCHTDYAKILKAFYKGTEYQEMIEQAGYVLENSQKLMQDIYDMDQILHQMCSKLFKITKKLKTQEEQREEARVAYDHYRNKLQKMEKTHAKSTEAKKIDVYKRNVEKFNKSKSEFDTENSKLDKLMEQIQIKGEVIIDQICIRFTCEVESKFFIQLNKSFKKLEIIEQQMTEISQY
ncbi:UNKNOWN [Stylonychia lemnae]|uniref:BAR domain-containing protein n=1 Tax=Stylonychia lemnae TaxID=5949 RepID=A0A077ZUL2_STYLE|nr:UNKNOWN [Stylonychia lemnae]|eukprot:CDW72995.1 UNKNOWN [Stylonychia lemnae]